MTERSFLEAYALQAEAEINRLRAAIQRHHDQSVGHAQCWENDLELWRAIGINASYDELKVPSWCEFMQRCAEYRASRDRVGPVEPT